MTAGVLPDEMIFTQLLEGCRLDCNCELGDRIFADMLAAHVRPSGYTLTALLKLYGQCGMQDKAYNLVATWKKEQGQQPSVIHYTCLISSHLRSKQPNSAWAAYELMEQHGVRLDDQMVSMLMPAMVSSQKFDCVLHLTRSVLQQAKGKSAPAALLNRALAQMG